MSRFILIVLWVFMGSGLLMAQNYTGLGSIEATSSGETQSIQYTSSQLGGYLNVEKQSLVFEMKTTSFFKGLNASQRTVLSEAWQIPSHPLMYFTFDLEHADLSQTGASNLNVIWRMGDRELAYQTDLNYKIVDGKINFSWSLPVKFNEIGIQIPLQYQDRMSDTFIFEVKNFAFIQR